MAWCWSVGDEDQNHFPGPLPAGQNNPITFASFNNTPKITPRIISIWSAILRQCEDSRLMLLDPMGQHGRDMVLGTFSQNGIAGERIILLSRGSRQDYLSWHTRADIALDPFPYNGGVTTCDALWMGLPVVALTGNSYVSRQGYAILKNLGLDDLTAGSLDEYVQTAVKLAEDRPRLMNLRETLRARMVSSPIMDGMGYTQGLEEAFVKMWKDHVAGSQQKNS
jgi:predicted O-linked N-acetylglucosamine transferase (SPINDLY family)